MGLIRELIGGGADVLKETVEVFKPNAEASAQRDASYQKAALNQFAAEFQHARQSVFGRFVDGLNRLPRPLMALSVMALFGAAMTDPEWFMERMEALATVPEPMWILLGAIVTFYFGGRFQVKQHAFKVAATAATAAAATEKPEEPEFADAPNPALKAWKNS